MNGALYVIGLSHRTATVGLREQLAISEDDLPATLARLSQIAGAKELFLVSTCNRIEVYGVIANADAQPISAIDDALFAHVSSAPARYRFVGDDALKHLFRVASSLDSMVVGEPQILGQVKDAFGHATRAGTVGTLLDRAVTKAFGVAKRVRTETGIGRNSASVASVAVDLAEQVFGDLKGRRVAVVGAGKMSSLAARHLQTAGVREISVLNRTAARAVKLAQEISGVAREFSELEAVLAESDIVIASTGAQKAILTKATMRRVMRARRERSIVIVDIAVPRDVEPSVGDLDNVYLYDVDDLERVVVSHLSERSREAERAEEIVAEEVARFAAWQKSHGQVDTIVALREHFLSVARTESKRVLASLGPLGEREQRAILLLGEQIANKLLHAPSTALKQDPAAEMLSQAIERLFPNTVRPHCLESQGEALEVGESGALLHTKEELMRTRSEPKLESPKVRRSGS